MESNQTVIDARTLRKVAFSSYMIQSSFNYERMQAGGWTYSLLPALEKIHTDKDDLGKSLINHMQFINTSPQLATLMLGIVIAMEEAKESPEAIQGIKVGLMGPLGGIGDALFFLTLLPISAGIGASLALNGNILGPLVFLILYNVPYFIAKFALINLGYSTGTKAINSLSENTKKLSRAGGIVGLSVVGALVASAVKLKLNLVISAGQVSVNIQEELFDAIMPAFLPMLITFLFVKLIRKEFKVTHIIFITVILSIVASFFGVV